MLRFIIIALLLTSCVTTNKVKRYMLEHPVKAAEICLEQFPQETKIDTIRVVKDSLIVQKSIDTIYQWLTNHHYSEPMVKEKIKTVIKQLKGTIYISKTQWDNRYKILYEDKDKQYAILEDKLKRRNKALFWTWLWIGIVGVGAYFYKKLL